MLWQILNEATNKLQKFCLLYREFIDLFRVRAGEDFNFIHNGYSGPVLPIYSLNMDPRKWYGFGPESVNLDCPAEGDTDGMAEERIKSYLNILAQVIVTKYRDKCLSYGYDYPGVVQCGTRSESKPSTLIFRALSLSFDAEAVLANLSESKFGDTEIQCLDEGSYSVMVRRGRLADNTIYFVTETSV